MFANGEGEKAFPLGFDRFLEPEKREFGGHFSGFFCGVLRTERN